LSAVIAAIIEAAPQWIVAVVLLVALTVLQRHAAQDRTAYRLELDSMGKRHAEEIERINTDHDSELTELRSDIRELRVKVDELQRELDTERRLRRQAEDIAAQASRTAGITITPGAGLSYELSESDTKR
jgi:TolA-binding protein